MWAPFCDAYAPTVKVKKANKKEPASEVEIRLYNHATNKFFYKRLTERELEVIANLLEADDVR